MQKIFQYSVKFLFADLKIKIESLGWIVKFPVSIVFRVFKIVFNLFDFKHQDDKNNLILFLIEILLGFKSEISVIKVLYFAFGLKKALKLQKKLQKFK